MGGDAGNINGFREVSKQVFSGTMAGIAQTVFGHPLDTVKCVQQTVGSNKGLTEMIGHIYKTQGLGGFFKGMGSPLALAGVQNVTIFGSSQFVRAMICQDRKNPTVSEAMLAGSLAGVFIAIPLAPTDVLKINLQVQEQRKDGAKKFNGPWAMTKHIVRTHGIRHGLFQGYGACVIRELNLCWYFGGFELGKALMKDKETGHIGHMQLLIAGGMGGGAFWALCYPFDAIKSHIQIANETTPSGRRHLGFYRTAMNVIEREGFGGLYKGFSACFLRGIMANAVIFYAVETARNVFDQFVPE